MIRSRFLSFSRFFLFLFFASTASLVFLLMLPLYQYYTQSDNTIHIDKRKEQIRAVKINLSKKPDKPKKLAVKVSNPKLARDLARADKFQLDLTATAGAGTGVALGSGDTIDIVYDQNQVDSLPVRLRGRVPRAPKSFSASGQRGSVDLEIVISTDGAVTKVSVAKEDPTGYGLASAAVAAVRTWKFRPALLNGIPVKLRVIQPFSF